MPNKLKNLIEKYEIFLLFFLALQPIIDVLTSLCISLDINITFGIIIRFMVLVLSIFYICIRSIQKGKKYIVYFSILLFGVIFIGVINNFFTKPIFSISEEGKFIFKAIYLFIMLFAYILAFNSVKSRFKLENRLIKNILIASLIISIVMVVSIGTSTSLTSYDYSKIGYTGWFFAGNEIGAILAIIFPLVLLYSVLNTHSAQDIYKWIPTILMVFSLLAVGTKVGYMACVLVLLIALFMELYGSVFHRKTRTEKPSKFRSIYLAILVVLLILITPFTPIYKNTFTHLDLLGIDFTSEEPSTDETAENDIHQQTNNANNENNGKISKEQVENLLLSSRELFLEKQKADFHQAPLSQKLFGMGYAGNYTEEPKMIEMDFYDLLYSFGIIGATLLFLPIIYFGIRTVIYTLTNIKKIFNIKYAMYFTSLILAFGIAFTAGHVLTAPAVSIFIAAIFAFILNELEIID
ncbi:O-antigen ligase family protein [Bacillaceae bacterium CLA-AA-H227]|uniref:O-antigen ligase family protein n=1 Tax=Robertmurraya yapensis (ex Hitch et al 2024) TaxID=3133160 RepID=A0ACC6SBV3_9BACI